MLPSVNRSPPCSMGLNKIGKLMLIMVALATVMLGVIKWLKHTSLFLVTFVPMTCSVTPVMSKSCLNVGSLMPVLVYSMPSINFIIFFPLSRPQWDRLKKLMLSSFGKYSLSIMSLISCMLYLSETASATRDPMEVPVHLTTFLSEKSVVVSSASRTPMWLRPRTPPPAKQMHLILLKSVIY